jgi:hypothetical protein
VTAVSKPLYIEQGATFTLGFTWHKAAVDGNGAPILDVNGKPTAGDPYDLTDCKARMQIRAKQGQPALVTATTENGRIVLGGVTGRIDITLTDEDTDLLTARAALYDLEIEWPLAQGATRPRVDRLLEGAVTVSPNVTQEVDDPVVP